MKQNGVLSTSQPMSLIEAVFEQAKIANKTVSAFVREALISCLPDGEHSGYELQTRRYHRFGCDSLTLAKRILEEHVSDEPVLARELMRKHRVARVADFDAAASELGIAIIKIPGRTNAKKAYVKQERA